MEGGHEDSKVMQHCVDVLTRGYVQSFVDLFYLTNRQTGKRNEASRDQGNAETDLDLERVTEWLTSAEKSRRSGNPASVFDNYENLATYFASNGQPKTSVNFYEKCLKLSQHVADIEGEKRATYALGVALSSIPNRIEEAIRCHERYLDLGIETSDREACGKAREQLGVVYDRYASELENIDLSKSVVYLEKLLAIASDSSDHAQKAMANFRIGKALNILKQPERAIAALEQSLEHANSSSDIRAQGEISAALADSFLQVNDKTDKAIDYLQETRRLAKQNCDDIVQAQACCRLGAVYTHTGDFDQAVHFYEQNFELVRKHSKSVQNLDQARVLLGLSRKNARQKEYRKMVSTSKTAQLLSWKTERVLV